MLGGGIAVSWVLTRLTDWEEMGGGLIFSGFISGRANGGEREHWTVMCLRVNEGV